ATAGAEDHDVATLGDERVVLLADQRVRTGLLHGGEVIDRRYPQPGLIVGLALIAAGAIRARDPVDRFELLRVLLGVHLAGHERPNALRSVVLTSSSSSPTLIAASCNAAAAVASSTQPASTSSRTRHPAQYSFAFRSPGRPGTGGRAFRTVRT